MLASLLSVVDLYCSGCEAVISGKYTFDTKPYVGSTAISVTGLRLQRSRTQYQGLVVSFVVYRKAQY